MSDPAPTSRLLRLPAGQALWSLAWPVIALGLIRSGYHLAAAYWAKSLPEASAAQAALGGAAFATWILASVAELASVGAHALVARAEGAGERWRVGGIVAQAACVTVGLGVVAALLAGPLARGYFGALGFAGPEFVGSRAMGEAYLRALLVGAAIVNLHTLAGSVFRGLGDTRTPMVVAVTTLLLNAGLDPVLMFGWGGMPALGLAGAGWATVLANAVGVGLYAVALRARGVRVARPSWRGMGSVVAIGTPSACSGVGFCLVYVVMGDLLASFGPSAVAGLGLGHRLEGPAYQVCAGFGAAAATLVGQHLGAGQGRAAAAAAHRAARWACVAMAPLSVVFIGAPWWLLGHLSSDAAVIDRGATYILSVGVILLPMALEVVYEAAFAGAGETVIAMAIVIVLTAARIPLAWSLAARWGLVGIWITIAGTCALKGLLLWLTFVARSRRPGWGLGTRLA